MSKVVASQIKYYKKSGARLYIPQGILDDPEFPFKDGDVLRIQISNPGLQIVRPAWFELINWSDPQMRQGFDELPGEIQEQIREKGLAPN